MVGPEEEKKEVVCTDDCVEEMLDDGVFLGLPLIYFVIMAVILVMIIIIIAIMCCIIRKKDNNLGS